MKTIRYRIGDEVKPGILDIDGNEVKEASNVTLYNLKASNDLIIGATTNSMVTSEPKKLMDGKASSVLSFGIKGGMKKGGVFIDNLKLITRLVNIGDAKSLACHPASTTHRQLSKDELKAAGVPEDLVRLSIGLENIDDIIDDLDQALKASQK